MRWSQRLDSVTLPQQADSACEPIAPWQAQTSDTRTLLPSSVGRPRSFVARIQRGKRPFIGEPSYGDVKLRSAKANNQSIAAAHTIPRYDATTRKRPAIRVPGEDPLLAG